MLLTVEDMEAAIGIEPMNKGFADLCLTTWLRRLTSCQLSNGKAKEAMSIRSLPSLKSCGAGDGI
jgi:hypothetical protein